jgi:hypothetical protein
MQFHHVSIRGTHPIFISYCASCMAFVGASSHEGLLKELDKEHRCPSNRHLDLDQVIANDEGKQAA